MGEEAPLPKRRFLGYPKEQVEQILADRDLMLRHAESRLRAGEARIAELEGSVTSLQQRNAALVASQVPREQLDAQATAFTDLQRHNARPPWPAYGSTPAQWNRSSRSFAQNVTSSRNSPSPSATPPRPGQPRSPPPRRRSASW